MNHIVFDWLYEAGLCQEAKQSPLFTEEGQAIPYKAIIVQQELLGVVDKDCKVWTNAEIASTVLDYCNQLNLNLPPKGGYYNPQYKAGVLYLYRYETKVGEDYLQRYVVLVNRYTKEPEVGFMLSGDDFSYYRQTGLLNSPEALVEALAQERRYVVQLKMCSALYVSTDDMSELVETVLSELSSIDAAYLLVEIKRKLDTDKVSAYQLAKLLYDFSFGKSAGIALDQDWYQFNQAVTEAIIENKTKWVVV